MGHVERIFVHKNWRVGYWQHLVSTGRRCVPLSRNYTWCFALSRRADVVWPPRSCDLTPLDYYLWGAVKDTCYADEPETINYLKDNIREGVSETQLHKIDNVLKKLDRSYRLLHGQPRQPFEWNYFPFLTGSIVLSNKKKKFEKIFRSFFKHFPKKKRYFADPAFSDIVKELENFEVFPNINKKNLHTQIVTLYWLITLPFGESGFQALQVFSCYYRIELVFL